jgi:hypothetical protein
MKQLTALARFLCADLFRLIAVVCLIAAIVVEPYGKPLALILVILSVGFERVSLWRKLRRGPGGEQTVKAAFAFSLIMVLSRMSLLIVLSEALISPALSMVISPLLLIITPLPLAGLYLQHRRMGEILFPASDRFLAPQFRALLLPMTLASPIAEWLCGGAIIALASGLDPGAVAMIFASGVIFSSASTARFLPCKRQPGS